MTAPEIYEQYANHEMVRTTDDEVIELYTCKECGALVRAKTVDLHAGWHLGEASA